MYVFSQRLRIYSKIRIQSKSLTTTTTNELEKKPTNNYLFIPMNHGDFGAMQVSAQKKNNISF